MISIDKSSKIDVPTDTRVVYYHKHLSIEESEEGKRKMHALDDIKAGELIIEEYPILSAVVGEYVSKVCHKCYREKGNLKRCSGCKQAHYCCEDDQIEDWKTGHKKECAIYKSILEEHSNKPIAHTISMVLKAYVRIELMGDNELEKALKVFDSNIGKSKKEKVEELYKMTAELILKAAKDSSIDEKKEKYMDLMNKIILSGVLITGKKNEEEWIACAIYPTVRSARHSCAPNAFPSTNSKLLHRLVAARSIQKGEEITFSYIDLDQDFDMRQANLKSAYNIVCECARCNREKDDLSKRVSPLFYKEKMDQAPKTKEDLELYLDRCNQMFGEDDLTWFRVFEVATQSMMRLTLHLSYYGLLSSMIPRFIRLHETHPLNPVLGVHLHRLACLSHKFNEINEAIQYASRSIRLLEPYFKEKYVRELKIILQTNK